MHNKIGVNKRKRLSRGIDMATPYTPQLGYRISNDWNTPCSGADQYYQKRQVTRIRWGVNR